LGANNVVRASINNGVKRVIVLSTDKAVYPINSMGLSKAMMEKMVVATSRTITDDRTILCCTRYGNVMASRGSVIPLFVDQMKNNQPVTITDPSMTRFMMSLEEAVDLVIFAFENGKQGDTFVQKAPAATIETLAKAISEMFNPEANIKVIGTRHGEKKYETLVTREEMLKATDLGQYYRIPADNRDLNYTKYMAEGEILLDEIVDYNSHNTKRLNIAEMKEMLMELDYIKSEL
jgi:UDP-glucose 4-epimerase